MQHTTDRTRASQPAPHVPPVDRRTNGHAAFAVQAAEQTRERAELLVDAGARRHPDGDCPTAPATVTWQQLSNRLIAAGIDLLKLAQQDGDPQLMAGYEALQYVIGLVDERAMEELA
ncbi:hypothetical protein [Streptomyces sp. NPDC001978]|uniref:hypothetical protein n=1 Tax=Streptomyces sp. NPDC001978 TaxID=3364627 RepID=UPI0036A4373A